MSDNFYIRVWGARGSIPSPGPSTVKYGGNTSCLEVRCGKEIIILDAGTGIRNLGRELLKELPLNIHIFFSHLHWDHIQGFPFFSPFYTPNNTFNLYAEKKIGGNLEQLLSEQMKYPFFPVPIPKSPSTLLFNEITDGQEIKINDITVKTFRANHPDGCLSYRIEYKNKSIFYATDTEHIEGQIDKDICKGSENSDVFIYDCNYTEEEYKIRKGWGHSTWNEGIKIINKSCAKKFILWHHDPLHDDDFINNLEKEVQKVFKNSYAAFEGMKIDIL
jgi:phosphoribosyl 1,2-cyclic phosphodiesterase